MWEDLNFFVKPLQYAVDPQRESKFCKSQSETSNKGVGVGKLKLVVEKKCIIVYRN